tara:strand:- start:98 stop:364 length:267 start_codon:yes stop_codon:yes gene_type:complete
MEYEDDEVEASDGEEERGGSSSKPVEKSSSERLCSPSIPNFLEKSISDIGHSFSKKGRDQEIRGFGKLSPSDFADNFSEHGCPVYIKP